MHENVTLDFSVEMLSNNFPVRFELNVDYSKHNEVKK
jgi:hypothetical protein